MPQRPCAPCQARNRVALQTGQGSDFARTPAGIGCLFDLFCEIGSCTGKYRTGRLSRGMAVSLARLYADRNTIICAVLPRYVSAEKRQHAAGVIEMRFPTLRVYILAVCPCQHVALQRPVKP